jgi:hypothetical protein
MKKILHDFNLTSYMENPMFAPVGYPLLFLPYWHGTGYFLLLM